ncbi:MAG: hypothetical protein IPG34_20120 [Rhodocyclaceae bacterium]|nr:hypothetical protein [Rhodocyclaceae bacterium]
MDSGMGFGGGNTSRAELEVLLRLRDTGVSSGIAGVSTQFSELQVHASKLDFSAALEKTRSALARGVLQSSRLTASMLSNHQAAKMHAEGQLRLARQIDLASTAAGGFRGQLDKMATSAQQIGGKLDTAYKAADAFRNSLASIADTLKIVKDGADQANNRIFSTERAFLASGNAAIEATRAISSSVTAYRVWNEEAANAADKSFATGEALDHIGQATVKTTGAVLAGSKVYGGLSSALAGVGKATGLAASHFLLGGAAVMSLGTAVKSATVDIESGRGKVASIADAFMTMARTVAETALALTGPWGVAAVVVIHTIEALGHGIKGLIGLWIKAHVEVAKFAWKLITDFGSIKEAVVSTIEGIRNAFEGFDAFLEKLSWFDPTAIVEGFMAVRFSINKLQDAAGAAWKGFKTLTGGFAALAWEAKSTDSVFNAFTLSAKRLGLEGEGLIKTLSRESLGLVSQAEAMEKINTATALIGTDALKSVGSIDQVFADMIKTSMAAARSTGQNVEYMFNSRSSWVSVAHPR